MNNPEDYISLGVRPLAIEKALGFDLFQLEEGSFRLYRHRSIPFTQDDIDKLLAAGREILYVPKNQRTAFYEHMSSHLKQTLSDPQIPVTEKMSALTETSAEILANAVGAPDSAEEISAVYKQSENHVIFALLGGDSQKEMQTTKSKAPPALAHAISVCNLSILLGIRCGIEDQQELRDIGAGALLHEVGKSVLDDKYYLRCGDGPQIIHSRLKNYPAIGQKLLLKSKTLTDGALRPVLEHQERLDGTGFPHNLRGKEIALSSRIVAICDHYDESTNSYSHGSPATPYSVLKAMRSKSKKFDRETLFQFICLLGGVN